MLLRGYLFVQELARAGTNQITNTELQQMYLTVVICKILLQISSAIAVLKC